jgi:diguanylate cyclase (GGDEF)-like protein/PAS domain S-box-containing protein
MEANPAMAVLLRCAVEDLVGSTAGDWVFPEDRAASRERFARLQSHQSIVETAEVRVLRRDGELAWTHASTSTLRDPAGAPSSFILQLYDITERHLAEEQLTFRATRDHLTGLANRVLFTEYLHEALAVTAQDGIPPAVLFVDIDRFKIVNDSMGHSCGDELLAQVARRLRSSMRPSDVIARFGGDEFAVLLREVRHSEDAVLAAQRLGDSLIEPFRIDRAEVYVNVSIGIALADSGSDVEGLLRDADSAMYRAKATGGSSHVVFDETVRAVCSRRMDIESGLHRAIAGGELSLAYQPIVETATGMRTGFEALLRWHRPNGEVISPAEFIPIAEESGTIVPIGAWVMDEACRQARAWRAAHRSLPPLTIAVNVSTRQLLDPAFFDAAVSASQSIYPDVLTLEITESAAAQICDAALATLDELVRRGVRIALDDFGTGESSLARLRTLPVHTLKIDRQFIADISGSEEDESLVRAILAMADALGLTAVAEGVETQPQAAILRKAGCTLAQGYLFGRPLPADEIHFHSHRHLTSVHHHAASHLHPVAAPKTAKQA